MMMQSVASKQLFRCPWRTSPARERGREKGERKRAFDRSLSSTDCSWAAHDLGDSILIGLIRNRWNRRKQTEIKSKNSMNDIKAMPRLAKWHRNLTLESKSRVSILCLGTNSSVVDGQAKDFRASLLMNCLCLSFISIASRVWFSLMNCKHNRDWSPGLRV